MVDDPQPVSIHNLTRFAPARRQLVSVAIICQVCGNTLLFNVFKLGLEGLMGPGTAVPTGSTPVTPGYTGLGFEPWSGK